MTTTITQPQPSTDAWETGDSAHKYDVKDSDYVKNLTVPEPSVISIYRIKGTPEAFKEYYDGTIVPWLDGNHKNWRNARPATLLDNPQKPLSYVVDVYLIGHILIVVCINSYQPWETIKDLFKHIEKVTAEQLPWPPKPQKIDQLQSRRERVEARSSLNT